LVKYLQAYFLNDFSRPRKSPLRCGGGSPYQTDSPPPSGIASRRHCYNIDAHDLYELVLQFPGVDGLVPNLSEGSNGAGALTSRVGIDRVHRLIGRGAFCSAG